MTPSVIRWRNAVFALFFINGVIVASWLSRIPAVRDDTDAALDILGITIFLSAVGAIAGLSLAAILIARFGARQSLYLTWASILVGVVVSGVGSSIFASLVIVGIGQFFYGLGLGSSDVIINVEGAEAERAVGKTLMPLMHAFYSFGTVLGAVLGALAAQLALSVLLHLGIASAMAAVIVVWALRHIPRVEAVGDDAHTQPRGTWKERLGRNLAVWRDSSVLLIGVGLFGAALAEGSANDWIALAAVDGHGLGNALGALVFGVFVAAMTIVRIAGGPIVDRWGRVIALRASALTAFAGLLLFVLAPSPWLMFVATALWGAGVALGFPLAMSAAADHPSGAARVGAVSTIGYAAFLVGPPVLGFAGEQWGILVALALLLPLIALSAVVASAARERSGVHSRVDSDSIHAN